MPNAQRPTSNAQCKRLSELEVGSLALDVERFFSPSPGCVHPVCEIGRSAHEAKKCYNLSLAMTYEMTASCMSTRTATLLLVVDRY